MHEETMIKNSEESLKESIPLSNSHRSFHPAHTASTRVNCIERTANNRESLILFSMVLNLGITVLAASAAIYLSWENYKRMNENLSLLSKLSEIETRVDEIYNGTLQNRKQDRISLEVKPVPNIGSSFAPSENNKCLKFCNKSIPKNMTKKSTTKRPLQNQSHSQNDKVQQRLYYSARFKTLADRIREAETSQQFFRSQIQQQLTFLQSENIEALQHIGNFVSFSTSLGEQYMPRSAGSKMQFQNVDQNDGRGYRKGVFHCPVDGTFLFIVNLVLEYRESRSNLDAHRLLKITLRVDGEEKVELFKQRKPVKALGKCFDSTVSRNVILKLKKGDRVDVFVQGAANWVIVGDKNLIVSSFMGILLQSKRNVSSS